MTGSGYGASDLHQCPSPIGWEYYINQKFAEGVARWPQAELIDWDAMAHSEQG